MILEAVYYLTTYVRTYKLKILVWHKTSSASYSQTGWTTNYNPACMSVSLFIIVNSFTTYDVDGSNEQDLEMFVLFSQLPPVMITKPHCNVLMHYYIATVAIIKTFCCRSSWAVYFNVYYQQYIIKVLLISVYVIVIYLFRLTRPSRFYPWRDPRWLYYNTKGPA